MIFNTYTALNTFFNSFEMKTYDNTTFYHFHLCFNSKSTPLIVQIMLQIIYVVNSFNHFYINWNLNLRELVDNLRLFYSSDLISSFQKKFICDFN